MKMLATSLLILATSLLAACVFLPAALARPALAQSFAPQDRKAEVELILPRTQARPGETLEVGIKFTMQPGWHIYWTNPGDSGQPPSFGWNLPGGGASRMLRGGEWTGTEPQFPVPEKFDAGGGLVGYGYKDTVVFPATIQIPASATPGQEVEIAVATRYLICEEICIPEQAVASAKVLLTTGPEEADRDVVRAIEDAKDALPTPGKSPRNLLTDDHEGPVVLSLSVPRGATNVELFPNPPTGLNVEDISVEMKGDMADISFTVRRLAGAKTKATTIDAVIGYDTRQGRRGKMIELLVPPAKD